MVGALAPAGKSAQDADVRTAPTGHVKHPVDVHSSLPLAGPFFSHTKLRTDGCGIRLGLVDLVLVESLFAWLAAILG